MELADKDIAMLAKSSLIAALIVSVSLTFWYWGEVLPIIVVWLSAIPLSLLIGTLLGTVLRAAGATKEGEQAKLWLGTNEYEHSSTVMGKIGEDPIYEWVVITNPQDPEHRIKLYWDRVITQEQFDPPRDRWFLLVPPGILYIEPKPDPEPEILVTPTA